MAFGKAEASPAASRGGPNRLPAKSAAGLAVGISRAFFACVALAKSVE
jgi:hypothetical protein